MPQMLNTITGKINWMPDSYIGQFPFEVVEEAPVVEPLVEAPKKAKKKAEYVPAAVDADSDGRVQDGTIFERPVGTELSPEEVTEILAGAEE